MTTILLTDPQSELVIELVRERPSWAIVPMSGTLPNVLPESMIWAFIDWDTPWLPAMEICQSLRQLKPNGGLTITMILDRRQLKANRYLLEAAKLDWISSPADAVEIVRTVEGFAAADHREVCRLTHGDLMVDPTAHLVRAKGAIVPLGPSELALLIHFMRNRGRICSRLELMGVLGKGCGQIEERTIDIWVGRLRRAIFKILGEDVVRTVRFHGYIMDLKYS